MDIVFVQPQILQEDFKHAMDFWAFIVVVFGILLSAKIKKIKVYIFSCLVFYSIAIAICYATIFTQFTQATIDEKYITLNYTSLNGDKKKIIERIYVKEVLYGSHGKTNNHCYISITTQSGSRYKSATIAEKPEKCKKITEQFKK